MLNKTLNILKFFSKNYFNMEPRLYIQWRSFIEGVQTVTA